MKFIMQLQKVNDDLSQKVKQQNIVLEEEKKRSETLKKVSDTLSQKYATQKKNFKALKIELKPKVELDEKYMEKCRKLTRAFFDTKKCDLRVRDPTFARQIKYKNTTVTEEKLVI